MNVISARRCPRTACGIPAPNGLGEKAGWAGASLSFGGPGRVCALGSQHSHSPKATVHVGRICPLTSPRRGSHSLQRKLPPCCLSSEDDTHELFLSHSQHPAPSVEMCIWSRLGLQDGHVSTDAGWSSGPQPLSIPGGQCHRVTSAPKKAVSSWEGFWERQQQLLPPILSL